MSAPTHVSANTLAILADVAGKRKRTSEKQSERPIKIKRLFGQWYDATSSLHKSGMSEAEIATAIDLLTRDFQTKTRFLCQKYVQAEIAAYLSERYAL